MSRGNPGRVASEEEIEENWEVEEEIGVNSLFLGGTDPPMRKIAGDSRETLFERLWE